jgi:hypothetical protein
MGDDPMALLGLEGALKHYYYLLLPPLRTTMGLPPTTRHRYAPHTDPIGVHLSR